MTDHVHRIARMRSIQFLVEEAARIAEEGADPKVTQALDLALRRIATATQEIEREAVERAAASPGVTHRTMPMATDLIVEDASA